MPLRNGKPLIWRPKGLTDALDGTNSFPGAMASLSNLIPDPSTEALWVARPPATVATEFPGLTLPGFVSGLLVIGNLAYGMIASALNPGQDEPFVYDIAGNTFQTITGVTSGNTPASPPTTGSWTPPIIFQAGSRIIVTHPGFPGDTVKFGWFDISGFATTITGDTVNGSAVITGAPEILGIQPGLAITGPGIPATTSVVLSAQAFTAVNFTGTSHSDFTIDTIASTAALRAGFAIVGPGIPPGTTITAVPSGTTITLSANTTTSVTGTFYMLGPSTSPLNYIQCTIATGNPVIAAPDTTGVWVGQTVSDITGGVPVGSIVLSVNPGVSFTISQDCTLTGPTGSIQLTGSVVIMSANATASADQITAAIEGGALGFPQWGAGDTQPNNLPSVPLGGAQMNGRAYFACGIDGIPFSDSGFPCQISDLTRTQALTTNDGLPVTAIGALTLASLLGGQVQSLVAFESIYKMQQITGDIDNGNLAMNALPVATGTNAPLSICNTEIGIAFVSPEGMRLIDFTGRVSPPTGDHGQGITVPFIYAVVPSRMCAAATAKTIRVSVENGAKTGNPLEEYWYDMARKVFHGPHTSVASLIQPWNDEFLMTFSGTTATLWVSPAVPQAPGGSWIENGNQLVWQYEPVYLMPDNGDMAMNSVVEMTLACGGPSCDATAPAEPLTYPPPVIGGPPQQPPGVPIPPNGPPPPPAPLPKPPPVRTPGLYYFEAFLNNITGNRQICIGIANSSFLLHLPYDTAVNITFPTSVFGVCPIFFSQSYGYPSATASPTNFFQSGDFVGVRVDTVNHLFWYRDNKSPNNWFGAGFPHTGQGFDWSANIPTGDIFILIGAAWGNIPPPDHDGDPMVTLNAGGFPFNGAIPAGYLPWDPSGLTTVNPADTDIDLVLLNGDFSAKMTGHITGSNKGSTHGRSTTSKQQV